MSDTARFVLAIVLSTLVMIVYFMLFPPPKKEVKKKAEKKPQPVTTKKLIPIEPPQKDYLFEVESKNLVVTFSKMGGSIVSIELKNYFFDLEKKKPYLVLDREPVGILLLGNSTDWKTLYQVKVEGKKVVFRNGDLEKIYVVGEKPYVVSLEVKGKKPVIVSYFKEKEKEKHYRMKKKVVVVKEGDKIGKDMKFFRKGKKFSFSSADSVSVDEGYFLLSFYGSSFSGDAQEAGKGIVALRTIPLTNKTLIYAGPKKEEDLKRAGNSLMAYLDFGFFDILAKPLLKFLKFTHRFTGNYGLDIIILTILIKILFFPLSHISYKSMKEMQKLQPVIENLKKKYKDDKQKLNQELIAMYRRHKINPLSGCLPILIQIPVFFALYEVLLYAIELRHAPFFWWIKDLSARDPYYITPIIMGITMILQQKLTPTSSDPTQEKLMYGMSIFFTILFASFPSGLVIYWTVNNILSIFQQLYTLKKI